MDCCISTDTCKVHAYTGCLYLSTAQCVYIDLTASFTINSVWSYMDFSKLVQQSLLLLL